VKGTFDLFQQVGDAVGVQTGTTAAKTPRSNAEGGALRRPLRHQPAAQGGVDYLAKGPPGPSALGFQLRRHIVVQRQRGAHIMMIDLTHHDVNAARVNFRRRHAVCSRLALGGTHETRAFREESAVGIFDKLGKKDEKPKADFSNVQSGSSSTAPEPAAPTPAPAPTGTTGTTAAEGSYVVVAGDSLSKIAKREYGDMNQWRRIYEANKDQISDPDLIHPGQKLRIPRS
jgi:nucleoid-associated protein YgaU